MSYFPKNFPFGKSVWIWQLNDIFAKDAAGKPIVDYDPIIQKCKDNNISSVYVKCGDGENTWEQWNQALVDAFHAAGIKIYSWSFVYGQDPLREAAIAMWALDMGADGHIFDAEDQFEKQADPATAAEAMLQAVRGHAPSAFLAYSPEPIIDYHIRFPYIQFGKYCDAVLPQIYFGEWNKSPIDAINWVYDNWSRWQKQWQDDGFGDSVKPLIPTCQAYDWTSTVAGVPDYVLKPADILSFCDAAKGYKAIAFYEYAHILRPDCWTAIKNAVVTPPSNIDLGLPANPNLQNTQSSAQETTPPAPGTPAVNQNEAKSSDSTPSSSATAPEIPVVVPPNSKVIVQAPKTGVVTVSPKDNPDDAGVVDIHISHETPTQQKVLLDYIIEFFTDIKDYFSRKKGVGK